MRITAVQLQPVAGDVEANLAVHADMVRRAIAMDARLVLFPELGLSAYTCDDLFHQHALLAACEAALARVVTASKDLAPVAVVGLPLRVNEQLFNCAAVVHRGRILGVVPKSYLPNYGEFYEGRQFNPAAAASVTGSRGDVCRTGSRRADLWPGRRRGR